MKKSTLKARGAKANAIMYMARDWAEDAINEFITGKKFEKEVLKILNDDDAKWIPPSKKKIKKKVVDK
jgi:hypothetical protein